MASYAQLAVILLFCFTFVCLVDSFLQYRKVARSKRVVSGEISREKLDSGLKKHAVGLVLLGIVSVCAGVTFFSFEIQKTNASQQRPLPTLNVLPDFTATPEQSNLKK